MSGLLRKDLYLIVKGFHPIALVGILIPLFVASQNVVFLMPILSIVIAMLFAAQITQTMASDETINWRKNVTAMPLSPAAEAGSKYLLLIILAGFTVVLLLLIGFLALHLEIVSQIEIFIYAMLGLLYIVLYGCIMIPASFKFGTANSKYVFMLFILLPTLTPVLLNMLHIHIAIESLLTLHYSVYMALVLILILVAGTLSYLISKRIIKSKSTV